MSVKDQKVLLIKPSWLITYFFHKVTTFSFIKYMSTSKQNLVQQYMTSRDVHIKIIESFTFLIDFQ